MENNNIQLEAIVCKCGAKYAASLLPNATDWLKSKLRAKKKGHTIERFDVNLFKLSKCECRGHIGTKLRGKSNVEIFFEYPLPKKFEPSDEEKQRVLNLVNSLFNEEFHKTKYLSFEKG